MRMRTVAAVDRYTLCSWPRHRRCYCFSRTLIAAIVIDRRPVRHGWWQRRREIREVAGSVHRSAPEQRQHRRDVLDLLFRHTEVVIRQHREICELPYLDLTLLAALAGEPGVRFGPQPQRLLAIERLRRATQPQPAYGPSGHEPGERDPGVVRGDTRCICARAHRKAGLQHSLNGRRALRGGAAVALDE